MQGAKWIPEREAYLCANYRVMSCADLAAYFGISVSAVCGKAHRMKLSQPNGVRNAENHRLIRMQADEDKQERFDWTPERLNQLKAEYDEKGAAWFAREWNMSFNAVAQRAYRMGLTKGKIGRSHRPSVPAKKPKPLTPAAIADCLTGPRGQSLRIVETVTARTVKPKQCAWIAPADGNGFRKRCTELAVPGKAWCPCCQSRVDAIREVA